jgi:nicotinamide-nucleotide amidase
MSEQALTLIAQQTMAALIEKGVRMATVESCTGGGIAKLMTDLAGSSAVFECGFVTYSNESKQQMVGVSSQALEKFGAVSEQVASEMASGALRKANAGITVSVTGIAGPDGGTDYKPVGTVCFGWAYDGSTITEIKQFSGDRQAIRNQTIIYALQGVMKQLTVKV